MLKKLNIILYLSFLVIYLEALTKIFITKSSSGIFLTILFSIPFILILFLLTNIFKNKGNKITTYILTILLIFYYGFEFFFHRLFSNIFSFNTLGLASNALDFTNIIVDIVLKNIWVVILYFIPLILLIILNKKLNFERANLKWLILSFILALIIYITSLFCLFINKNATYSPYNLYYNINSEIITV